MSNYHTQHAPFGAFASFTLGLPGARGGFGQALGGPAAQNVFVGCRSGPDAGWQLLPFFEDSAYDPAAAYLGPASTPRTHGKPLPLPLAGFERELGWATSSWRVGPFVFRIHSPWDRLAEPASLPPEAAAFAFAPVVCASLEYDNTAGAAPAELIFGLGAAPGEGPWRPLGDTAPGLAGFAQGPAHGFATAPSPEATLRQGFSVLPGPGETPLGDHRGLFLLGGEAAIVFRVPAGERRRFPLALGFFDDRTVATGLVSKYYYTRFFASLEAVLAHGLAHHERYAALAAARDAELASSRLDADQRWLLAQATHSYLGSTQLLDHGGAPLWVVNEGEYRMINTFDLTVDHLFFELDWQPWAVRDTLDLFVRRYAFSDTIHPAGGLRLGSAPVRGGLSFTHDMGVNNQFTAPGTSSYEMRDLHGCFSQMTMEQLVNWVCCAVTYAERAGDAAWLRARHAILRDCAESLRRRDDPEPARRDGILKWDSDRCGPLGSEITTYDSLDVSLGQARNNLYLAGKTLAAWLLLERAFAALGDTEESAAARAASDLLARTLAGRVETDTGFFPAVFEADNRSRILPAIEGLVFPLYLGFADEARARHPGLFAAYERHLRQALQPGVCLDAKSGAWKISSTSHNTWFSKIALAQHVARSLFPAAPGEAARAADAVHARFQQSTPCGRHAMVDQVHSETGADLGSRYYPRVVTACLWLRE